MLSHSFVFPPVDKNVFILAYILIWPKEKNPEVRLTIGQQL